MKKLLLMVLSIISPLPLLGFSIFSQEIVPQAAFSHDLQNSEQTLFGDATQSTSTHEEFSLTIEDNDSAVLLALQSLGQLGKAGLNLIRKNPLKALVTYLALQPSSHSMLGVNGFSVTNYNQNLTMNGSTLPLLPISVSGTLICNATIALDDISSGTITSSTNTSAQKFLNGVWNTYETQENINRILAQLYFTRSLGHDNKTIYLRSTVYDAAVPSDRVSGTIQINPSVPASTPTAPIAQTSTTSKIGSTPTQSPVITTPKPTTTQPSVAATTFISSKSTTSTKVVDMSSTLESNPQLSGSITTEKLATTSNTSTSTGINSNTTASEAPTGNQFPTPTLLASTTTENPIDPLINEKNDPQYAIIGGVIGGLALSCGLIAGAVAYGKGLCSSDKKNKSKVVDQELAVPPSQNNSQNNYAQVNIHAGNDYQIVHAAELLSQGYEQVPAQAFKKKNEYDSPDMPF